MSKSPKGKTAKPAPADKPAAKPAKAKAAKAAKARAKDEADQAEQAEAAPVASKPKAKPSADAPARVADPALAKRLEEMTDFQLRAYQTSTAQIAGNPAYVKSAAAKASLPLIEAEVARRKISPGRAPSPVRAAVASPKTGKKRD
jgi:hypothetical protein